MNKFLSMICGVLLFAATANAQTSTKETPKGWHLLDQAGSGHYGISLDKAYSFLKSQNLKSNRVIVAVIDSGIDTLHEDLKPVLWVNEGEIPGNGIDDDKNGYIDDIHGWNFIGGKDGRNVKEDSYEASRVYHLLKEKWEGKTAEGLNVADAAEYATYIRAKEKVVGSVNPMQVNALKQMLPNFKAGDSVIRKELGKEVYDGNALKEYKPTDESAKFVQNLVLRISKANESYEITNEQLIGELEGEIRKADAANVAPPNFRNDIVQDDYNDINDRYYGNNDIMANTPFHGTHVSGIIAAARNNGIGMDGIADNVRIMTIRAVPDGDEHDKDIANAIRYAVDNGAKVINMSFGKDFSPQKEWVDEAFAYAEQKGVLLIHAAGNDAKNLDTAYNFPTPVYESGKGRASNVLTIGASGTLTNGGLTASFSNYGKNEVDIFAPGVGIYSTIPGGNTYGNANGTSMASPVVAGVAALILQYYPNLSPQEVKLAIEKSAQEPSFEVNNPETEEKVAMTELSRTGGIMNAEAAVKAASEMSKQKAPKSKAPKTQIKKSKKG